MADQTYWPRRTQGTCECGDRLGMLSNRENIVLPRRCPEAGEINGDQAIMLGERRVEERHECQAAVGKGVEKEKRSTGGRTSSPDEKPICQRHIHRTPPLVASNADNGQGPRRKSERSIGPHAWDDPAERI
jgi:hypothetical protein